VIARQRQIGHQHLAAVAFHLEERELPGRLLGHGPPEGDEAFALLPLVRLIAELGHRDVARGTVVAQAGQTCFHGWHEADRDGEKSPVFLEEIDDLVAVEGRVGPDANLPHRGREFLKGPRQERERDTRWMHIARMKTSLPEVGRVSSDCSRPQHAPADHRR